MSMLAWLRPSAPSKPAGDSIAGPSDAASRPWPSDRRDVCLGAPRRPENALDDALGRLAKQDQESAELVRLKYFAGLSVPETADILGRSQRTVERQWAYARAWLQCRW